MLRVTLAIFAAMSGALAQTFDVASVKPSPLGEHSETVVAPAGIAMHDVSLHACIEWAYDTQPYQLVAPTWANERHFDIDAKAGRPTAAARMRAMMRNFLADRFGLVVHREKRELQVYMMVVAKGGPKLRESTTEGEPTFRGSLDFAFERTSMRELASRMSGPLRHPILDATALTGRYDFHMDVRPYVEEYHSGTDYDVVSMFTSALRDQLGLLLKPRKSRVEVIVVDHVAKLPTEQ